jgi:hypothetical protein
MGKHDGTKRFLRAGWAAPAALLVLSAAGHALAAPLDPRYGAGVELQNLGTTLYEGQRSASGRVATGTDGTVITEGGADFSGSPASYVYATSAPGRGVIARAYLLDTLTFDVAGGGFAEVPVRMAGTWRGVSGVDYFFVVGPTTYVGRGSSGVGESYVNGAPAPSVFTTALGGPGAEPMGTFLVDGRLSVADGGEYQIYAGIRVTAAEGDGGYMDDPVTILPPAGVTFTSASGSTYAVPEPSALLWIAAGCAALARVRRTPSTPPRAERRGP